MSHAQQHQGRDQTPRPAGRGGITMHPLSPVGEGPAGVKVDEELARILEGSFAALAPRGSELVTRFYEKLFAAHPALRGIFPADMSAQEAKLLDSLRAVIDGLRRPAATRAALLELGRKHVAKGVRPEHYPPVCEAMLEAMAEVAAPGGWNEALEADWRRALGQISRMMVEGATARAS